MAFYKIDNNKQAVPIIPPVIIQPPYSTTETLLLEKWIDGSNIYQRVFEGTLNVTANNVSNNLVLDSTLVPLHTRLINSFGSINYNDTNNWHQIPYTIAGQNYTTIINCSLLDGEGLVIRAIKTGNQPIALTCPFVIITTYART